MVFGEGDFNDIRDDEKKSGERGRQESNFRNFRRFMEEVNFVGSRFTWANNITDEGFVKERLAKFFRAPNWQIKFPRAKVIHVEKQTSDHCLLMLATEPEGKKLKAIFVLIKSGCSRVKLLKL